MGSLIKHLNTPKKLMSFDSNMPEFGNSAFFSSDLSKPVVRFNNFTKITETPGFWVITVWIKDLVKGIEYTLETVINFLIYYADLGPYMTRITGDFVTQNIEVDTLDKVPTEWSSLTLVRRLTLKELDWLEHEVGVEIDRGEECVNHLELLFNELPDGEESPHIFNPKQPSFKEAFLKRAVPGRKTKRK